ncbi:hypothetical protein PR048_016017 [Dryococelus australis]|uniref:Zinc finger BED domain-containing protein 4 n=1 Tax=Dryococelus australis TaxID=614101 RepID=A0ABQ9HIJ5_9NEOP|nr:hypothetical protein PR048_016017 [Dryococelus australis]
MAQVPQHCLIQDEPTRWNSTYYMFNRLLEQKRAIQLAVGKLKLPAELTSAQWNLLEYVTDILKIFETVMLQGSKESVTVSEVTTLVHVMESELSKPAPIGSGLQGSLEDNPILSLVTLLDPRFKALLCKI